MSSSNLVQLGPLNSNNNLGVVGPVEMGRAKLINRDYSHSSMWFGPFVRDPNSQMALGVEWPELYQI